MRLRHPVLLLFLLLVSPASSIAQQPFWELTGFPGGAFRRVVVDSAGEFFASTSYDAALLRSDDGTKWEAACLPFFYNAELEAENGSLLATAAIGSFKWQGTFHRSTDGGRSWIAVDTIASYVTSMAVLPSGAVVAGTGYAGIYRSSDATSWDSLDVADSTIYHIRRAADGRIVAGGDRGVWISSDDGISWTRLPLLPAPAVAVGIDEQQIIAVSNGSLYRLENDETIWRQVFVESDALRGAFATTTSRGTILLTAWKPQQGGPLPTYLLRSTDGGGRWDTVATLPTAINDIAISGEKIVAATHSGLFMSTDDGASWSRLKASASTIGSLDIASNDALLAHAGDVFISTDRGDRWRWVDSLHSPIVASSRGPLFTTVASSLWRSDDFGLTWSTMPMPVSFIQNMAVDPNGNLYLLSRGDTTKMLLWKSTDDGRTWLPPIDVPWLFFNPVEGMNYVGPFLGSNGEIAFGEKYSTGMVLSTDNGATWHVHKNMGMTVGLVREVVVHQSGAIFAISQLGEIARSEDKGTSFQILPFEAAGFFLLRSGDLVAKRIDRWPSNSGGYLYSLVRSSDLGRTWETLDSSLVVDRIDHIVADKSGRLYAATRGLGVLRSTGSIASTPIDQMHDRTALSIESSDSRDRISIAYRLHNGDDVRIDAIDMRGDVVATVFEGRGAAGENRIEWNAASLPAGAYIIRLTANRIATSTVVVLP